MHNSIIKQKSENTYFVNQWRAVTVMSVKTHPGGKRANDLSPRVLEGY